MPSSILDTIVAQKRLEVKALYEQYSLDALKAAVRPSELRFYDTFRQKAEAGAPFVIAEFKRKSPSEGWINQSLSVTSQVQYYATKGASAVSVLTDTPFFGGAYADLLEATEALSGTGVLRLQKDFIIDPIQIYLARKHGANLILLIAAILSADEMQALRAVAEGLGMGVLAEVHSLEEYHKLAHIGFPVVGVNNRDLSTFKTALNCCNYIARHAQHTGLLVAESGMGSALDMRIAGMHAKGFLIGTSLMRKADKVDLQALTQKRPFLKACGIRTEALLKEETADLIGINFSPISKRRGAEGWLDGKDLPGNAVAVFKGNSAAEVRQVIAQYGFQYVQLYADDFDPEFVKTIKQKVLLAISVKSPQDLQLAEQYAPYIDLFILDGAMPGSGEAIAFEIPKDFPYPFLLAGGMHIGNIDRIGQYDNCIGTDLASGIETDKVVDAKKIEALRARLREFAV